MTETWVFDTGPLSAFAKGQLLSMIRLLAADARIAITYEVEAELNDGLATVPQLADVINARWITRVDTLDSPASIVARQT